jgi:AbrB family looped-hinge helix DNA binding protein
VVTRISTRGRVVLPKDILAQLGLQPGDLLDVSLEDERVILTPARARHSKPRIIQHPVSGLPVMAVDGAQY